MQKWILKYSHIHYWNPWKQLHKIYHQQIHFWFLSKKNHDSGGIAELCFKGYLTHTINFHHQFPWHLFKAEVHLSRTFELLLSQGEKSTVKNEPFSFTKIKPSNSLASFPILVFSFFFSFLFCLQLFFSCSYFVLFLLDASCQRAHLNTPHWIYWEKGKKKSVKIDYILGMSLDGRYRNIWN